MEAMKIKNNNMNTTFFFSFSYYFSYGLFSYVLFLMSRSI